MSKAGRAVVPLVLVAVVAAASEAPDPRSQEIVRFRCLSGEALSDLTLFGNGTLRLREGPPGEPEMTLSELDPDSYAAYVRRLQAEKLGNDIEAPESVEGLFTEQCVLELDVPDGPSGAASFGQLDSLSLELGRVVAVARELVVVARANTKVDGLSSDYVPHGGDVLLHRDGGRYLVRSLTTDERGVELIGLDQPLTIYVALEALPDLFLGVEAKSP